MPATPYDDDNIFAKILRGELPAHKVYEDAHNLAFLDIMPRADGHTLVIPKTPARNLLDADPESLCHLMAASQKVGRAVMRAFEAPGLLVQQFNEADAGQVVFHLHVHLIPRRSGQSLRPHTGEMADQAVLARHAERIRAALAS